MTTRPVAADEIDIAASAAFADRLFAAGVGALEMLNVELGTRLGLYEALAPLGAVTARQLAAAAAISERYAREWLEQQTVAGVIEVDDHSADAHVRRFTLPPAHARVLLDRDSESYTGGFAGSIPVFAALLDTIAEAFRTGGGVPPAAYAMHDIQGEWNRPTFLHHLIQTWIPALPDVHAKLRSGTARVCDIGCGVGFAAIQIARAFPGATVDGYDVDDASVREAHRHAAEAGVADRVRFYARDASRPGVDGSYDLVFCVEMLHDVPHPVGILSTMRAVRAPGGAVLVVDERVAETFTPDADEMERLLYACSTLACLPVGMVEADSAGTGAVIRPETVERYAMEAGFSRVEVLDIDHPQFRLYALHG